jgi:hypothetical protein
MSSPVWRIRRTNPYNRGGVLARMHRRHQKRSTFDDACRHCLFARFYGAD